MGAISHSWTSLEVLDLYRAGWDVFAGDNSTALTTQADLD